jgi:hypothetical protein
MLPQIRAHRLGLGRSLLRGRYMAAVSAMELEGVPIDVPTLTAIRTHKEEIKLDLVREVDQAYGVYEGTTFKQDLFEALLDRHKIAWRTLATIRRRRVSLASALSTSPAGVGRSECLNPTSAPASGQRWPDLSGGCHADVA